MEKKAVVKFYRWMLSLVLVGMVGTFLGLFSQGTPPEDILTQLREIPTATLSDAVDQVVKRRGFMSYDMRPIGTTGRMAGRAKTVLYGPVGENAEGKNVGPRYGIQIIDESGPGDVMVGVTQSLDITGIGGLMTLTAKVRRMEGAVIDGAVRDVAEIRDLGFPVFSRSISPSTMVSRYTSLARDIPVTCAGVTVYPGDYIVGDQDGVVCIPSGRIEEVLARALEMEETEKKMVPLIQKIKSLQKAVELFKRI